MLCLFAIFNFWRGIFYSWTTTLFWTWILFSCLFCFHSYLLFSLYFYYLQFDFNYAKFVEKNNKQFVNSIGDVFVLYYCTFLLMGVLDFARNDSTPACAGGQVCTCKQLSLRTFLNGLHIKTNIIRRNYTKSNKSNQNRKTEGNWQVGFAPLLINFNFSFFRFQWWLFCLLKLIKFFHEKR